MADFGGVNLTTTVGQPTARTEESGLSDGAIIGIVSAVIAAVGVCFAILGFCYTHGICKKNGRDPPPQAYQQVPLQPRDGDLQHWRTQLRSVYEKLFIPTIPGNTSRQVAEVDELATELRLLQETGETYNERLPGKETVLEKPKTTPLDSWKDFFNSKIVKNSLIILSGGAGFGKSTLFKIIANTWTKTNELADVKLLFLIELKKMKTPSIIDAVLKQCFPPGEQPLRNDLITMIKENQKQTVFLLDGLDELSSEFCEPADDVYCVDNVLHNKVFEDSRVFVSTRQHMVEYILKDNPLCSRIQTLGFTSANVDKFIMKYFSGDESKGKELISFLKGNPLLRNLAEIPVICQMICRISKMSQSKLSDRMTGLYKDFTEVLARRRCGDNSDWKQRLETALEKLGEVALDGLLRGHQVKLMKDDFKKCASILDDECEGSGFIQQENFDSIFGEEVIVTFLHKTFEEYSAAYYFASLYRKDEDGFLEKLKQINAIGHVDSIVYLLRFTCGIASESEATGLILKHVQELERERDKMEGPRDSQRLTRLFLYESGSDKWADELKQRAVCQEQPIQYWNQEDLIALQYYLQCVPPLELGNKGFQVACRSCEDLTALKELLLSGNFLPAAEHVSDWSIQVWYTMGERGNEEIQILKETLEGIGETLRKQFSLQLLIGKTARFDENCQLRSLPRVKEVDIVQFHLSSDDANCLALLMQ